MATASIHTPLGTALLKEDENGFHSLQLNDTKQYSTEVSSASLRPAVEQLQAYFLGASSGFNLTLAPKGTDFQKMVWTAVSEIPWGQQVSYLEMASTLGNPKAVRAVAAAISKNPLLIIIPCHRVIGSNGQLTGYAGGIWRKKWLLQHEQATVQVSLF